MNEKGRHIKRAPSTPSAATPLPGENSKMRRWRPPSGVTYRRKSTRHTAHSSTVDHTPQAKARKNSTLNEKIEAACPHMPSCAKRTTATAAGKLQVACPAGRLAPGICLACMCRYCSAGDWCKVLLLPDLIGESVIQRLRLE